MWVYKYWLVVWNMFFPYIGKNNPNWLICFRGVQTTNQNIMICYHMINYDYMGLIDPTYIYIYQ